MTATETTRRSAPVRAIVVMALAALVFALLPAGLASAAHFADETRRIQGEPEVGRFGTAAEIAMEAFPDGADQVVVARGDVFADALAGSLLAGQLDAPILLSEGSQLTEITADTIETLADGGTVDAFILGGLEALDTPVEEQLADLDAVAGVDRVSGETRFETAEDMAATVGAQAEFGQAPRDGEEGGELLTTGILATGFVFADALMSAPLAFADTHPLLLSTVDELHPAAERAFVEHDVEQVLLAGGEGALSAQVEADLEALGINVVRVHDPGGDRTATAAAFASLTRDLAYEPHTRDVDGLALANGFDELGGADALAMAPLTAKTETDLVLTRGVDTLDGTPPDSGDAQPSTFIRANCQGYGAEAQPAIIAGGTQAISDEVVDEIKDLLICDDFVATGDLTVEPEEATNPVGTAHTVSVAGVNPKGEPAEGAAITLEVFREGEADDDDYVYIEDDVEYVHVDEARQVAELDAEGQALISYEGPMVSAEDRVVVSAPPVPPADPEEFRGVDEDGNLVDGPYGSAVVDKTWAPGTPDESIAIDLDSNREVEDPDLGDIPPDDFDIRGSAIFEFFFDFDGDDGDVVFADIQMLETDEDIGSYEDGVGVHIHEAVEGETGPIVAVFDFVDDETLSSRSTMTIVDDEFTAADLIDEPEEYYLNVHTDTFGSGVARGQFTDEIETEATTTPPILAPAGANEVGEGDEDSPNPLGPAGGDAIGTAEFTHDVEFGILGYDIALELVEGSYVAFADFAGVPATHIHEGFAGQNGPVDLGLRTLDDDTDSVSTFTRIDADLLDDLIFEPEEYYLNVHTEVWPGGVARAQFDGVDDGNPDDDSAE